MVVLATPSAPVPDTTIQDFKYNNATEPQSLDPALMQGTPEFRICMALFEGLVVPNAQTAKAEPGLACQPTKLLTPLSDKTSDPFVVVDGRGCPERRP